MRIYFSGIGGVGIGPLAEIAHDAGYEVAGSDIAHGLMTEELEERGIEIAYSQSGAFLGDWHQQKPIDWFVHTAALPDDHPELTLARELGIRTAKRDELLAEIIKQKDLKLIAVAGTHGKTTTTGMLVWALQQLGLPVSYSIGTTLSWGPSGHFDPASEYFVYECDEFDRNFLHFQPHLIIITALDYDHPDTYPSPEDYRLAFVQFIEQSNYTLLWEKDLRYLQQPDIPASYSAFDELMDLSRITLAGDHTRHNAFLVLEALERIKQSEQARGGDEKLAVINSFPGTARRFEKLADNLYSDYGHHPAEITATLQMARELSDHVALVYQPHQNIRQHEIRHQYTDEVFADADNIYWLPTHLSREDSSLTVLTPEELTSPLSKVHIADLNDQLWDDIQRHMDAGHLVLCMGAGSIDGWARKQLSIRRVARIIITEKDTGKLIMQKRDSKPGVSNPGKISTFGGSMKEGETPRQAVARELREETNISFVDADLTYLKTISQPLDDGTARWTTAYTLKDVDTANLKIYEGEGYVFVDPTNNQEVNLTPNAREFVEYYALNAESRK